jgi:RNA 3'-terminal phosphate cyclase (ATP)
LAAAILPPLLFAPQPSTVVLTGGTHVPFSPPGHYLTEVFLPSLARLGAMVRAEIHAWGWYPEGGGELVLHVTPCRQLSSYQWPARSTLRGLELTIGLANLPEHIARREEKELRHLLQNYERLLQTRNARPRGRGCGNLVFLRADYSDTVAGFSSLGRRGWPAEAVATAVAAEFLAFNASTAGVDCHLADQLLLYLALAQGNSGFFAEAITSHLRTNLAIIEQLLPVRFALEPGSGGLQVQGAGYAREA